uniref:Regulator of thyroid function and cancer n=1 Tax=Sphenodon punctatus TaxID=8508 RepID=A0A8D0G2Q8_SPHPU
MQARMASRAPVLRPAGEPKASGAQERRIPSRRQRQTLRVSVGEAVRGGEPPSTSSSGTSSDSPRLGRRALRKREQEREQVQEECRGSEAGAEEECRGSEAGAEEECRGSEAGAEEECRGSEAGAEEECRGSEAGAEEECRGSEAGAEEECRGSEAGAEEECRGSEAGAEEESSGVCVRKWGPLGRLILPSPSPFSIKSSWNISVVKFLLERLRHELAASPHNYTDKELKGACVAYFLTKRREYRNSLNPFKGLKEKEEKKLRSRRYRLFANRSGVARLLGPEEQRLWQGVTEELMSDEEDSLSEPGVWVLCYRLDANSKHGTKANRVYGPPSERLPSAEAQLLPLHLYNPRFQEEEEEEEGGGSGEAPFPPSHKTFCPDLSSFIEIKVEKDE